MSEAGLRRRLESKIGHRAPPLVYKRSSYHQAVLTATVPHIICHPWSFTSRPVEIVRSATPFIAIASNGTVLPLIPLLLIFHNNSPHFSCPGGGNPCRNRPRVFLRQPSPSAPFMVHDYTPWAVSMRTWAGSHKSISRWIVLDVLFGWVVYRCREKSILHVGRNQLDP
jgi:hypothetical protein